MYVNNFNRFYLICDELHFWNIFDSRNMKINDEGHTNSYLVIAVIISSADFILRWELCALIIFKLEDKVDMDEFLNKKYKIVFVDENFNDYLIGLG